MPVSAGISILIILAVAPVSYTHLDVYKRQDRRSDKGRNYQ